MNESESKSLLKPEERRGGSNLLKENDKVEENEQDWWESDDESSSRSYYSDTESSIVEWESEIGLTGEVFYIESSPESNEKLQEKQQDSAESPPQELMRRRSTRARKLMRLIRRRESKRYSTRVKKSKNQALKQNDNKCESTSKEVKFQDYQAGEIKEVMFWIDPEKRHKLGRRATLCEAYLGIIPGNFSDKVRVMVSGFIPNGEAIKNKNIKIGDWLRSISGREVTSDNLEFILSDIINPISVKLELQRVAGVEVTVEETSGSNIPKQSPRVRRLIIDEEESKKFMDILMDYSFAVLFLKTTGLSETGPELQGVIYNYPRSENKPHSFLCSARGAFITLNHLLPETMGSNPVSTTISIRDEVIHVLYSSSVSRKISQENKEKGGEGEVKEGKKEEEEEEEEEEGKEKGKEKDETLLLIAIPERWYSLEESTKLLESIVRTLKFTYGNFNLAFQQSNHSNIDHFFNLIFTSMLQSSTVENEKNIFGDQKLLINPSLECRKVCEFESIIGAAHLINLPRDAQIQIDAALNEMEAMDYRDWNEDPMDCQRLYTILGSCLFHKSYLLASHLSRDDLKDIHAFLRLNGLFNLVENEPTKSLVIWRSVHPSSMISQTNDKTTSTNTNTPDGKYFILIVGFGYELLAVMLECGGCTSYPEENEGPDVFYVEEAQETLKHIQKIGISNLAAKWISANARPETINFNDRNDNKSSSSTIAENLLGLIKSTDTSTKTHTRPKTPEVTSILKKKSPEESPTMSGSVYSLQISEDSMSQGTGAVSEVSDDTSGPILGRRATREMYQASSKQSDDSDSSDVDMYRNDSQNCSMNVSDIRNSLLNQAEYIPPKKLTTGKKNSLFHYVHLDNLEGILLSSRTVEDPHKNSEIMKVFNRTAHSIHKLFDHAMRFKDMVNAEVDNTTINKNLVAIKEQGVLFEHEDLSFWVVGRLYGEPNTKEFYVCYQDDTPQNIIEMAFKLNETTS